MLNNTISLAIRERYYEKIQLESDELIKFFKAFDENISNEERLAKIEKFLRDLDDRVRRITGEASFYSLCLYLIREHYKKEGKDVGLQNIPELTAIYILYTRAGESILDTLDKKFIWEFIKFVGSYLKDKEESKYEERVRKYEAEMKPIETIKKEERRKAVSIKDVLIFIVVGIGVATITILILSRLFPIWEYLNLLKNKRTF